MQEAISKKGISLSFMLAQSDDLFPLVCRTHGGHSPGGASPGVSASRGTAAHAHSPGGNDGFKKAQTNRPPHSVPGGSPGVCPCAYILQIFVFMI